MCIDYDDHDYLLFDNADDDFIKHGKLFYNLYLGDAFDKIMDDNDDHSWNSLFAMCLFSIFSTSSD